MYKIRWRTKEEGGRTRPPIFIPEKPPYSTAAHSLSGECLFSVVCHLELGDNTKGEIVPLVSYAGFEVPDKFYLQEGRRIVAEVERI